MIPNYQILIGKVDAAFSYFNIAYNFTMMTYIIHSVSKKGGNKIRIKKCITKHVYQYGSCNQLKTNTT